MSSLQRYKKSGGFFQLLSLIETFGPAKKEKFLEMIEQESAVWARALREKMLSLERIFGWPEQVVIEIFKSLPHKSQAFALTGLKEEYKAKITKFLTQADQRRLNDVLTESQPKPEEVQATLVKILELTRKLLNEKELLPEKFDTGLIIPEGFESKLEEQGAAALVDSAIGGGAAKEEAPGGLVFNIPGEKGGGGAHSNAEVHQLQKSLAHTINENKALKNEVKLLRDKLDAIRKIA